MEYNVGTILRADGELYKIIGKIQYKNIDDNCRWLEYRLKKITDGSEVWLSVDEAYDEYSVSHAADNVSLDGYKKVDEGTQEVVAVWGRADVSVGDRASFTEYEDASEEKIISEEVWDDGREVSVGYYLDWNEVAPEDNPQAIRVAKAAAKTAGTRTKASPAGSNNAKRTGNTGGTDKKNTAKKSGAKKSPAVKIIVIIFAVFFGLAFIGMLTGDNHSIAAYLKDNTSSYAYVTSITGSGKEKADVYRAVSNSMDMAAKDIIRGIEGDTTDVQQNSEGDDRSIAILTEDEYCLIYTSEDNEVLVQVSSREYAYRSDKTPYHCHAGTYRYYRGFYYTRGYQSDMNSFGSANSSYGNYDGGTVDYNSADEYSTYSSSIRQSSVGSRTSSGGGLSSGK